MTEEQRARLAELRAKETRTPEEEAELAALAQLEEAETTASTTETTAPAATQVAASVPAVPRGVPGRTTSGTTTTDRRDPLTAWIEGVTAAFRRGDSTGAITAALADVTHSEHTSNIEAPAWSGELWSGLQYEPEFTPLLNSGDLTNWEGHGWRWVEKPQLGDYAGDKAAIPTNELETEASGYEAARMAVGHDLDRKFYDFPNEGFLRSYAEAARESWAIKLDQKVRAWILANAVVAQIGGVNVDAQPTVLKAAMKVARSLKRGRVGKASFILLNDDDFDTLMDISEKDVPAFLELFDIDPKNFKPAEGVPQGTVIGGVKQAATVRTLPGSPIRVDAQRIANGGVDSGFFGYWAIEEHHPSGVRKVGFEEPVAP